MFYSNTLNLIQVGGGTQVKQGDLGSRFSYKLANENDQELDDFDKEVAHINLVLDDKIVFTTTATVDNSTVTFNIDKAIPVGLYFLEIKIRDYIFPSDKQTIIFVQSGAVAYDLKELVPNYDVNITLKGILSDLSQKGIDITDLKTKMNAIYNNALADHAEVAQARGGFETLSNRLSDINNQIKNVASGSPKGVYANLAALQTAKPNGDSGIYTTTDNGHWYYYNNGWKDGGVYQATGIADGSITPEKTSFYTSTGNLFNVLKPNANLLSGALTVNSGDNVSIIKLNGKPSALGATTVTLMTGSSATGTYIAFDTSAQYTLTAKLLSGKCFDTRAVSLVVQRTDNNAPMASINMGNLLQNGGVRTETFTPTFKNGKVSLIFSAGAYDIDDCEILINITKGTTSSVEPFGYRMSKSVDNYEQNKKIESLFKHDMYDYIVDKAGTGDFTTLTECVRQAKDMSVIYVKNGLYENEIVKAWLKTVFIIGESRDGVIITNSTGEYATPPIEMGTGLLRNLTIYAKDPGGVTPKNKCYALHSESSVYNYFKFEIDNCNIISDWRQSWGMGMRGSMVYNARNVNFDGGVYFHDNEHTDGTVQKIFFDNCNITRDDNGAALLMQDQQMPSADIDVRFNRCFIKSLQGSEILFYKWDSSNKTVIPATGFADFPTWRLNAFSWGNSEAALNA